MAGKVMVSNSQEMSCMKNHLIPWFLEVTVTSEWMGCCLLTLPCHLLVF